MRLASRFTTLTCLGIALAAGLAAGAGAGPNAAPEDDRLPPAPPLAPSATLRELDEGDHRLTPDEWDERIVESARRRLQSSKKGVILVRDMLKNHTEQRERSESNLKQAQGDLVDAMRDQLGVAVAEEHAMRKWLAWHEAMVPQAEVGVEQAEFSAEQRRALRKERGAPGIEANAARQARTARLHEIAVKSAVALEKVAEAAVEFAEAELNAARKRLDAARGNTERARKAAKEPADVPVPVRQEVSRR